MRLGVISEDEVRRHLNFELCIPAVRRAMIDLSAELTRQTLRQIVPIPDRGVFGVMQGALPEPAGFGAKVLSVFPGNVAKGEPSHQGLVILFDPESGSPLAAVNASAITAIRTAAASAAATDALARPDAECLAILGSGEQAMLHAEAICTVRPVREIRVWGRTSERAAFAAQALQKRLGRSVSVEPTVAKAVAGADIICTTTAAQHPILFSKNVAAGAHVNVVGSSYVGPSEVDTALVARARFFADHRASVLTQGAEFLNAKAEQLIDDDHVLGEIGAVFEGRLQGRIGSDEVTLYKSLGNIVQDLAAAELLARTLQTKRLLRYVDI